MNYIGRFAPSPTGPLHFGSLIAAAGSYLEARSQQGHWLLRIDDLDPPREVAGAADNILRTLEAFGFAWDGQVLWQSQRARAYHNALVQLDALGLTYACICSRKQLVRAGQSGLYPGTCRHRNIDRNHRAHSLRIYSEQAIIEFKDALQGYCRQDLAAELGDFPILRRDGVFAYHLATVVDDAEQGITHIVRGADLLECTPRQIYLQQKLSLATPQYMHLPIAINRQGRKLSKQSYAKPVTAAAAVAQLWSALSFLGQEPVVGLKQALLGELWEWALTHWSSAKLPRKMQIHCVNGMQ